MHLKAYGQLLQPPRNINYLNMKNTITCLIVGFISIIGYSQDKEEAIEPKDSLKMTQQWDMEAMIAKFKAVATYPVVEAGPFSGIVPVEEVTEIPDPNLDYKLMFELTKDKTDSLSGMNADLVEIARVLNLHVASGIPKEKLFPVIVVHGPALNAFTTDVFYNEKFKKDNPNLKLIQDLEALGAKYIACAQAMFFFDVNKESLLPNFKVSLTAQTVLSSYQMKGYVKYW